MSIKYTYNNESKNREYRICNSDFTLRLENETKAFFYFFENYLYISVKESKRAFFELRKILLHFFIFEEPYKTQYVREDNLEENTADTQKFTKNSVCISAWGDNIDEIPNLVGECLPFTECVLDARNTEINRKTL